MPRLILVALLALPLSSPQTSAPASAGLEKLFTIESPGDPRHATLSLHTLAVTPDFFRGDGMQVLAGRAFTTDDTRERPLVAIINEAMAARVWPSQNPIGQRIRLGGPGTTSPWMTIVGVAGYVAPRRAATTEPPLVYTCRSQAGALGPGVS